MNINKANVKTNLIDEITNSENNAIIDLDDTTLNFMPTYAKVLNERHDINLDVSDIVHYDIELIKPLREKGITNEEIIADLRYLGNKEEFVHIPLIDGFMEFYKLITDNFNNLDKVFFVTSRSHYFYDDPREKTVQTLQNNNVPFLEKNLILDNDKHDFAIRNNVRFVFDDSLYIARQFLTNNYSGHIIMNNTPFNTITEKDKILLEEKMLEKKTALVNLTIDARVTRMNGWNDLLSKYRGN